MIAKAKQYLERWRFGQSNLSIARFPKLVQKYGDSVCGRPHETSIKVSVDATTFRYCRTYGVGLVARDSYGELILSKTISKQGLVDAKFVKPGP